MCNNKIFDFAKIVLSQILRKKSLHTLLQRNELQLKGGSLNLETQKMAFSSSSFFRLAKEPPLYS